MMSSTVRATSGRCTIIVLFILMAVASAQAQNTAAKSSSQRRVDFIRDVRPILQGRCFSCHGPGEQMAGFRLDQKESALRLASAPGKSDASKLICGPRVMRKSFDAAPWLTRGIWTTA